jgi:hypothetical protein
MRKRTGSGCLGSFPGSRIVKNQGILLGSSLTVELCSPLGAESVDLSAWGIWCREIGVVEWTRRLLWVVVLIGGFNNKALFAARQLGLELGLGLAGVFILSSTKLEQSRSQPQNKGSPGTGGFSLGSVGSVS